MTDNTTPDEEDTRTTTPDMIGHLSTVSAQIDSEIRRFEGHIGELRASRKVILDTITHLEKSL